MISDIERRAGSLFIVGFPGHDVPADLASAITAGRVGGVILFSRNFEDTAAGRALCERVRGLSSEVLIAIDQEGGRVQRLRAPFPELPAMRRLGERGDPELIRRAGDLMGRALRAVGVHQNYAPVLDVDSNPANPVIGDRAFGRVPADVARFGRAFVAGLQARGVAACGKHFPGHGDTERDSHVDRPWVRADADVLRARELAPFADLARTDLAAMMSAHVVYPALDPDEPATFSPRVLLGLLRRELGFEGAIVSDDLEMGAVERTIPEAAVAAVAAGCDQLLVCSRPDDAEAARAALVAAVETGRLPAARLADAARRGALLRRRWVRPPARGDWDALWAERDALVAELEGRGEA
jgi:beta-N-acetylhexosaminidase